MDIFEKIYHKITRSLPKIYLETTRIWMDLIYRKQNYRKFSIVSDLYVVVCKILIFVIFTRRNNGARKWNLSNEINKA